MSNEFEKYDAFTKHMEESFPKMFTEPYGGFCVSEGWWPVLANLCANIQHHIDRTRKDRHDALVWNRALSRAMRADFSTYSRLKTWQQKWIDEALGDPEPQLKIVPQACWQVVASQVKEKFGTLRFYYSGGDDIVSGIERMAESMTAVTCETCGAPGKSRSGGWIQTLCDTHAEGREELVWKGMP